MSEASYLTSNTCFHTKILWSYLIEVDIISDQDLMILKVMVDELFFFAVWHVESHGEYRFPEQKFKHFSRTFSRTFSQFSRTFSVSFQDPGVSQKWASSQLKGLCCSLFIYALVKPLLKKLGLELVFPSFRPVSNLPFISKLTEKASVNQLTELSDHMNKVRPLPSGQSAYRPFHSTETALLKVQSDILLNMDDQKVTLLVMFDLSAAFDTNDHSILLETLGSRFGVGGTALKWFMSKNSASTN